MYSIVLVSAAMVLIMVNVAGASSYAYITNGGSDNISVIDTDTNTITRSVNVGDAPEGVAVAPDGKTIYVSNYRSGTVSIINIAANFSINATVPVGSGPSGVAINPTGTKVYAMSWFSNNVSVIDTTTKNVIAVVNLGNQPHPVFSDPVPYLKGIAVTPNGEKVYVANYGSDNISVLDTATNTVTATVTVGNNINPVGIATGIAITPNGTKVFATNSGNNTVYVIDTSTNNITATVPVGNKPSGVAVSPDGQKVYVTNILSRNVSVINTATNNVTASVSVGVDPCGVAVSPDGTNVYVANYGSNNVSVIDTATNNVIATVNVGNQPIAAGQFIGSVPEQLILPVANFTTNVTRGSVPLTVQFSDLSTNTTGWSWDFGDESNSTAQNPTHTYFASGFYTVNLTVSNANGTDSKLATILAGVAPFAYITNTGSNTVSVINTANNVVVTTVPVGNYPWGVAVTPDGKKVYVTNFNSNNISVIDTATNTVITTVNVPLSPIGVSVTPDGTKVYVTTNYNIFSVINTTTDNVTANVTLGSQPIGVAVAPDGTKAYMTGFNVSLGTGTISVIDTATNNVTATVNISQSYGVAVSSDGTKVYVTSPSYDILSILDTATNTIIATVNVGNSPLGVAVSPDRTKVYVTNEGSNNVSVIDTATNNVIAAVNVGNSPFGVSVTPDGTKVYVANNFGGTVSVIDTATNAVLATVFVENQPYGVAVNPDGTKVYVTNAQSNTVSVIDTATNNVTATVNVGLAPFGVAVTPDGTKVYVANNFDSTVSVIDTSTNTVTATILVGSAPVAFGKFIGSIPLILAPGQNVTVTNNYTITQADLDNGSVTNSAFANGTFNGNNVPSNTDEETVTANQYPTYEIIKIVTDVAGNGPFANVTKPGQLITYQINVTNTGNLNLTNVSVNDTLINISGPVESISQNGVLEVGEVWTYSGTYKVTVKDIYTNGGGKGFIENTATVDSDQLEPKSDSAQVPIKKKPVEDKPDCIIQKTVIDVAEKGPYASVTAPGDKITYEIAVANDGNVNLTNITVKDTLIKDLSGPIESINQNGILEVDEFWIYTGTYTVTEEEVGSDNNKEENEDENEDEGKYGNKDAYGFIENTATVDCDQLDPRSDTAKVTIKEKDHEDEDDEEYPAYCISKSIIAVDEKGDCIINEAGDIIKYRIVVKNEGNVDLTDVSVHDDLIELEGPKGDDVDRGVLNVGETWKFYGEYEVTEEDIENDGNAEKDGYIENTATVSCNELPDKKCTEKEPILQKSDFCIYKSVIGTDETGDCIINEPGDIIQYQVIVKNEGKVDLTGIEVEDSLVELDGPEADNVDKDRLDSGRIKPGEVWKYIGSYEVTEEDIEENGNSEEDGYIENTATVSCNELPDKTSTAKQQIFLKQNKENKENEEDNSQDNGNNQNQNNENQNQDNNNQNNNQNNGNNQNNQNNSGNNQNNNGGNSGENNGGSNSGSHSSSSSSKGGSGGLTTSPEAAKNIETKESAQGYITNGKNTKFDFVNKNTCVMQISFDAKKTLGKTKATVEMLKGKSSLVSEIPADEIYSHLNIWIGNNGVVNSQNMENAQISFRVEKQWIKDKNINQDTITLQRYNNGKWEKLQTTKSEELDGKEETDKYLVLTAKTPGFSPFVITAKILQVENKDQNQQENKNNVNIEPKEKDSGQNKANTNAITKENAEKEQKQTQTKKSPGFEILITVAAILAVLIHRKRISEKKK